MSVPAVDRAQSKLIHVSQDIRLRTARRLSRHRDKIAGDWVERHRQIPSYAEAVAQSLPDWSEYRRSFASPLIGVLAMAFKTGNEDLLYVYAHERLRFAERLVEHEPTTFGAMLAADTSAIAAAVGENQPDEVRESVAAVLDQLSSLLLARPSSNPVKVALIGDCIMTEILSFLRPALAFDSVHMQARHLYFSARAGVGIDTKGLESLINASGVDLIALSFLTFEGLPLYSALIQDASRGQQADTDLLARCETIISLIERYVAAVRDLTTAPILLHGCSGLPLGKVRRYVPVVAPMSRQHALVRDRLDDGIAALCSATENAILIDERKLAEVYGLRSVNRRLLPRLMTRKALFHPSRLGLTVTKQYQEIITAYQRLAKAKVLLIDFDNTLWSGVMAEGDVVQDRDAQATLIALQEAGILLVSVSKNDPESIRWDEMLLTEDDFVLHKISWNPKAQSVLEIAENLNLDPTSFVLIDDNPVERELVTSAVPGVLALDPGDPRCWPSLRLLLEFPATRQTEEAARRTTMYREAAQRREATVAKVDYGTMMRSLDLRVLWKRATPKDLERLHELVSRTNQFNTTTVRYSLPELRGFIDDRSRDVRLASLSDKFGSLGVVGSVVSTFDGKTLTFESIVMSCRAMGFGLEDLLVRGTLNSYPTAERAIGKFIPTDRNGPSAGLFAQSGFALLPNGDWALDVDSADDLDIPSWLDVQAEP